MRLRHRVESSTAGSVDAPVLAARNEFEHAWTNLARARANWQRAFFGLLLLTIGLLTMCAWLVASARVIPWIVEVDRFGRAKAFGPAEQLRAPDERFVRAQLSEFVRDVRTVYPTDAAERDVVGRAYAYVDPAAAAFLNQWFGDTANNPRVIARDRVRTVEVTGMLRVPASSVYRVSWIETDWPIAAGGGAPSSAAWEGYIGIRLATPRSMDDVVANPLGVYVTSITWAKSGRMARDGASTATPEVR
jgi:type IV secretory pathway TrbF-like protein